MSTAAQRARLLGISALIVAVACIAALHALRPDLAPASHRLSEYAHGRHSWLMVAAFLATGLGVLATARALRHVTGEGRWTSPAPALLVGAGTGMVLSAVFPTGPNGAATYADLAHSVASGAATLAVLSAAWLHSVRPLVRQARGPVDLAASGLGLTALVLAAVSPMLHETRWTGLGQRLLWLALTGWLLRAVWCTGGQHARAE